MHPSSKLRASHLGIEGDIRDLDLPSGSFDVAIDKATMDAMMTVKGDIWVSFICCLIGLC
jgi:hypothetical protein